MEKNKAIIVDVDGTLAGIDHRLHFLDEKPKNWSQFHENCTNDKLNYWCYEIIEGLNSRGFLTLLLTGRGEEFRQVSESWLSEKKINYHKLFMRSFGDRRSDSIIKEEIYKKDIEPNFDISFVIEDRKSVVTMWRNVGLVCLQCNWGDF